MADTPKIEKDLQGLVYEIFSSAYFDPDCASVFLKGDILNSLGFGVKYLLFQGDALARENKLLRKMLDDARIVIPEKSTLMRRIKTCPYCGEPLRTSKAKQCFKCHTDWHDPDNIVKHDISKNKTDILENISDEDDDDQEVRRALGLDD